jgi:hypothetical protein
VLDKDDPSLYPRYMLVLHVLYCSSLIAADACSELSMVSCAFSGRSGTIYDVV